MPEHLNFSTKNTLMVVFLCYYLVQPAAWMLELWGSVKFLVTLAPKPKVCSVPLVQSSQAWKYMCGGKAVDITGVKLNQEIYIMCLLWDRCNGFFASFPFLRVPKFVLTDSNEFGYTTRARKGLSLRSAACYRRLVLWTILWQFHCW